jgi:hypothetical protein
MRSLSSSSSMARLHTATLARRLHIYRLLGELLFRMRSIATCFCALSLTQALLQWWDYSRRTADPENVGVVFVFRRPVAQLQSLFMRESDANWVRAHMRNIQVPGSIDAIPTDINLYAQQEKDSLELHQMLEVRNILHSPTKRNNETHPLEHRTIAGRTL